MNTTIKDLLQVAPIEDLGPYHRLEIKGDFMFYVGNNGLAVFSDRVVIAIGKGKSPYVSYTLYNSGAYIMAFQLPQARLKFDRVHANSLVVGCIL